MAGESALEQWARMQAAARGCKLVKWSSPGNRGVPDRIFFGRKGSGFIAFLEFKNPKKGKTSLLQQWWIAHLGAVGFRAELIDSKEKFQQILDEEYEAYHGYP